MQPNDTIRITRQAENQFMRETFDIRQPEPAQDLTESEFRQLLGHTLVAMATSGMVAPEAASALLEAGEYIAREDPTGDDNDFSILGTFTTIVQIAAIPERVDCTMCGETAETTCNACGAALCLKDDASEAHHDLDAEYGFTANPINE